jgi:hypothetical protein
MTCRCSEKFIFDVAWSADDVEAKMRMMLEGGDHQTHCPTQ